VKIFTMVWAFVIIRGMNPADFSGEDNSSLAPRE